MEPKELSPILLDPLVIVVTTLRDLLHILPRKEEMMLLVSPKGLHRHLQEFTKELQAILQCIDDTWQRCNVTSDDGDPVTSLSQALVAYKSTPGTSQDDVARVASKWQGSVSVLMKGWARLGRAATELRDTCRGLATKAADRVGTATAQGRELQAQAARDGTALERMGELGQALGGEEGAEGVASTESLVRREAMEAASEETRVIEHLQQAVGLLERLVAACDEATAFPRELQRLLRDIEAALKGTNEASPDVPEDLVAKVAEAERLWEANARLAKDHLLGTIHKFTRGPASPISAEVAEWCYRPIKGIESLFGIPEHPQTVPKVSAMTMEPQELSPALLQPQVTMVSTLGELLDTLNTWEEEMLLEYPNRLHSDLEEFTKVLWVTLRCIDDTWWRCIVTDDDGDPVTSLSRALAAYNSTPQTTWRHVTMVATRWQRSVSVLVDSWKWLAKEAKKLIKPWSKVATEVVIAQVRELQAQAARDGTAQKHSVELGQALGRAEGAEGVARTESLVRREPREASSEETRVTMERQRLEKALRSLVRFAAAFADTILIQCTLQCLLWDIEAFLQGTSEAFPTVPEGLVAKMAEAERLWEANARLVKDHLLGAVDNIIDICSKGSSAGPSAREVAERCQRAIEDIPRLLRPPERPQSVPEVSPLSPALLQPQVSMVATMPRQEEEMLLESPKRLYRGLKEFTKELWANLQHIEDIWRGHTLTSHDGDPATSLSRAPAAYKGAPRSPWDHVTMVARWWQGWVAVDRWTEGARKATEPHGTGRELAMGAATARARELQDEAARDGTALEHSVELGQALGREEGAEVVARHGAQVRREARVAASEATRATMERERVEVALGLLQHLVATCDEATMFPQEVSRLPWDIEDVLDGKNKLPDFKHLLAECEEGISILQNLCRRKETRTPDGSSQLSPALLQPQVTVVATLGELLDTLHTREEETLLLESSMHLHRDLEEFTKELRVTLQRTDDTWRRRIVTDDDGGGVTSLSQVLAAYKRATQTSRGDVAMAVSKWQRSVSVLVNSWAQLARKATKLHNTCRGLATKAADRAGTATTQGGELQAQAARDGTALERMGELGQALGREEGTEVAARPQSPVREEAREAASEATRAGQRLEAALGPLERLVAACDEATVFPRELQRLLGDTETALEGTSEVFPTVPEDLVAKVAEAERLWEANVRLAKDHLLGIIDDFLDLYSKGGRARPSAREVAERCQRAIEDIPNLLQA